VSRSEGPFEPDASPKEGAKVIRLARRDDVEINELDIKIRISYKTLLLAFVFLDVFHRIFNAAVDSDTIQGLL